MVISSFGLSSQPSNLVLVLVLPNQWKMLKDFYLICFLLKQFTCWAKFHGKYLPFDPSQAPNSDGCCHKTKYYRSSKV